MDRARFRRFRRGEIGPVIGLLVRQLANSRVIALLEIACAELTGRILADAAILFAVGTLLDVERVDLRFSVHRRFVGNEFFVLGIICQFHVGFHDAIDQFLFLILSPGAK